MILTDRVAASDINVLALVKGEEKYVVLFTDANRAAALRSLGVWASTYDLSFNWRDAAWLAKRIREA